MANTPRKILSSPARPIEWITVVGLLLAVAWRAFAEPRLYTDYRAYHELAQSILDHHQFGYPDPVATRLPGYPFLLAVLMALRRSMSWLNGANVALVVACIPLVYEFTKRLFDGNRRMALIAAGLVAVNPTFVLFSSVLASEHLFVLLFIGALVVLLDTRIRPPVRFAATGALLGFGVLTRGEVMFYLPVLVVVIWLAHEGGRRERWKRMGLLVGACAVVVTPWVIRNALVIGPGAGLSTVAGFNFYVGHNGKHYGDPALLSRPGIDGLGKRPPANVDEIEKQKETFHRALEYLVEDPRHLFADVATGTHMLLWETGNYPLRAHNPTVKASPSDPHAPGQPIVLRWLIKWFYRALLVLSVASLFLVPRMGRNRAVLLYGIVVMNWMCYAVVFFGKPRFRYTTEVVFCILAAVAIDAIWNSLRRRSPQSLT